jgi:hypothetical protein
MRRGANACVILPVLYMGWDCSSDKVNMQWFNGLPFEGLKNGAEWLDDCEEWIEREVVLVHSTLCNLREVTDQTAETLVRTDAVSGHIPTEHSPL